ncbi:MAG: gliding motility protein GldB [Flavobacteriales bacterium]|nr:gliding motility protein GldB [Flavobacteriales bacterium]
MKKANILVLIVIFFVYSCKEKNNFDIEPSNQDLKIQLYDVSADFYNDNVSIAEFQKKYLDFFNLPDEQIQQFRTDSLERRIYKEIQKKIDNQKIKSELNILFLHIKHYYPSFIVPKVYVYSSVFQSYTEPIVYNPEQNTLLILADCFLGEKNEIYNGAGIENYFRETMSSEYIIPKVSYAIAETVVPIDATKREFLNHLVFNGKVMLLQDAFLPNYDEYLKILMTKEQHDWCKENEYYIWSYFLENELLFSNDSKLLERFINIGPFSKFYLEIDGESPSRVGVFIGANIVKNYYDNSKKKLPEVIVNPNYQQIFTESGYKPNK